MNAPILPTTRWKLSEANKEIQHLLVNELDINPIVSRILINRNISNPDDAKKHMSPSLNDLHNPFLLKDMRKGVDRLIKAIYNREKVLVIMAPLLIEAGMINMVDLVIVIKCHEEIQKIRLMERENINELEAERRIRSQMPSEEKNKYADFIIDNSGSLEETAKQVDRIWPNLKFK